MFTRNVWLTGIVLLAFPLVAAAQDKRATIQAEGEIGTANEMRKGGDPVTKKYDNNLEYGGFKSSPIIIDPRDTQGHRQRIYPELSSLPNSLGAMAAFSTDGAQRTDLSVDDEIFKASKAIFQFKGDIENDFVMDTKARDRFLDMYTHERGIAILTLSYLDKTVAAGLATVQQQADNDVSHAILQQISWNESKLANPQRAHMYDDVDAKFERCMVAYFNSRMEEGPEDGKLAVLTTNPISNKNVNYSDIATRTGLPAARSKVCLERVGELEKSPYHFCTCVASMSRNANSATYDNTVGLVVPDTGPIWSLVDLAFKGLRIPKGDMQVPASVDRHALEPVDPDDPDGEWDDPHWDEDYIYGKDQINQFATNFRAMYGDIVMYRGRNGQIPVPTTDGDTGTVTFSDEADDEVRIRYMPPQMSVPNWVRALRDRHVPALGSTKLQTCQSCPLPGNDTTGAGEYVTINKLQYCPITGGMVNHGICPSLRALVLLAQNNQIEKWRTRPEDSNEFKALSQFWIEASLGAVINAKNIMDINSLADVPYSTAARVDYTTADLHFNEDGSADTGGVQENGGAKAETDWGKLAPRLRRYVESYCDASAINAFKKLHLRMMSIAADHLLLNRALSQLDREQVLALMNRVTLYLDLANEDSAQPTDRMLIALGNEADRRAAAETTAATQSFLASIDNQTQESEIHMFGGNLAPTIASGLPG